MQKWLPCFGMWLCMNAKRLPCFGIWLCINAKRLPCFGIWLCMNAKRLPCFGIWLCMNTKWLPCFGIWLCMNAKWLPCFGIWLCMNAKWIPCFGMWLCMNAKRLPCFGMWLCMNAKRLPCFGNVQKAKESTVLNENEGKLAYTNTAPGMPAARILNTRKLKVVGNLSESYIQSVKAGNPAKVELADGKIAFSAAVSFAGKNINPLSRSFQVEIQVPAGLDVRPGMSARVRIEFKNVSNALTVPVNVVQTLNGASVVYIAEETNGGWVARKRAVEVGGIYDNRAEIVGGLKAGDKIITVGYQSVNDGEPVGF